MKVFALLFCALLNACAHVSAPPVSARPDAFFRDSLFKPPTQAVNPDEVFALSDAMTRYLHFDIAQQRPGARLGHGALSA